MTWLPVVFDVKGDPAPKGSKRGFVVNGRAVLVEDSKRTLPWLHAVRAAAEVALRHDAGAPFPVADHVAVLLAFRMRRPKSHTTPKGALRASAPRFPQAGNKHDIDKLARCVLDALTDIVIRDDAQVVRLLAVKAFAGADEAPGCRVVVRPANPWDGFLNGSSNGGPL